MSLHASQNDVNKGALVKMEQNKVNDLLNSSNAKEK